MSYSAVTGQLNQINNNTNQVRYEQGQKNLGTSTIGKDGFLQLLLAQLQNQDPLSPMDNAQFVSQQAQFTQVEQLDNISRALSQSGTISQASSMVGKNVEIMTSATPGQDPETISGVVDSVEITDEGVKVNVGGEKYNMENIIRIFAAPAPVGG